MQVIKEKKLEPKIKKTHEANLTSCRYSKSPLECQILPKILRKIYHNLSKNIQNITIAHDLCWGMFLEGKEVFHYIILNLI